MTEIEKIRSAVEVLSTLSDGDWKEIEKITSKQPKPKEDSKVGEKQISHDEKEKRVTEVLKLLGIPSNIKGYAYARKAILLMMEDTEKYSSITQVLYPTLAQESNTTSSRVERAIRHAVEIAWERGNTETQNKIFGYSISPKSGKPTNSELITCVADYVKMYML